MATEYRNGWTVQSTKASGLTIRLRAKEHSGMPREMSILVSSKQTRQTVTENTPTSTAQDTKVSGSTTSRKVKERRLGLMVLNTWANTRME
jgi:hypothetical protein